MLAGGFMSTDALYEKLPAAVAESVRAALATSAEPAPAFARHAYRNLRVTVTPANDSEQRRRLDEAFTAVAFPTHAQPIPLVETLTPEQRALAELVSQQVVSIGGFAIPKAARVRRRWLGLDPAGALEQPVSFTVGGETKTAPLWHALATLQAEADDDDNNDDGGEGDGAAKRSPGAQLFASLPLASQLETYGDIALGAYALELDELELDLEQLRDEGKEWAPRYADLLLELFDGDALHEERGEQTGVPDAVKLPLWLALVRSGVTLEQRWDLLLPIDESPVSRELLAALPEPRRAPACIHALDDMFPNQALRAGVALLADVPSVELAQAIVARIDDVDGQPKRRLLQRVAEAGAANPAIGALVAPLIAALPLPLGLRLGNVLAPTSRDDLNAVHIAQCARGNEMIMGCSENWVGDEDIAYLQLGEVLDADGRHAYDFAVFMDEDGVFFRAGTDEPVAVLCQYNLDCPDAALKEGFQLVLADKPRR
jgi:hypothetical protein